MRIFNSKERNDIMRYTVEQEGVAMSEIISRVGKSVAAEVDTICESRSTRIVVFAGWGTNGAYALSAAKFLLDLGYSPEIHLFNIGGTRISVECSLARKTLRNAFHDYPINEIVSNFEPPVLNAQAVVIDGLFGAELDKPLPKSFGMLIRNINESNTAVVSIEIPSGLLSEWNDLNSQRDVIRATVTLAVGFPCLSFFMEENLPLVGEWKIVDAGFSIQAIRKTPYSYYLVTYHDVHRMLRQRSEASSKADYGSALICAGQYGMMGAGVLATRGCLRSGAGKVTCYGPRCGYQILQTTAPSAMYRSDRDDTHITSFDIGDGYNAIAVGPGIGTSEATIDAVESLFKMMDAKGRPLVIDADALNCIAKRPRLINYVPVNSLLTPHAGEFDRMFGEHSTEEARIRRALEIAKYHKINIILKGRYSTIIRHDGKVHINSSGTPALATAGSGDVLTGIITGFEAQGHSPEIAAILGTFIHGVAGEIAEETHGSYGVTAEDVADCVGRAIKSAME